MATSLTAHYHFQRMNDKMPFCIVTVDDVVDLFAAQNFGELILKKYSGAQLTLVSHARGESVDDDVEENGDYTSIGLYAEIHMKSLDGKKRWVKIPAPLNAALDADQRVPLLVGQEVADMYSQITGNTYVFKYGALTGKSHPKI